ncbi:cysteine peptidase family C39 domain-containing protein [Orbus wheelerorum]|uniref:cysteine peptidase family C39 domain-containing protein n=1 Tax=Orbus wheelerorum TaxID=3074111 RepID=UPI00370D10ED
MTGHDVGEATFYTVAGTATATLGGKVIQWIDGKWTPVKVSKLEPGNPTSTSIVRNGDRLVLNQGNFPTCGANSCAMSLNTLGKEYDLGKLITDSKVGTGGASMLDVTKALKNQGVNDARFISKASLEQISIATSQGNPVIVAINLNRGGHAVVVDGITVKNGKAVVAIRDPAGGRQYFTPLDEFKQKFTGQAIFTNSKSK